MKDLLKTKEQYLNIRERIFNNKDLLKDAFNFSVNYSLLVEEYIVKILEKQKYDFAVASAGSFSRRELAPYSDIDLMFIVPNVEEYKDEIRCCITTLWDCGIEASHTVREFSDIQKFLEDDLHAFTQFFETRFILGNVKVYSEWNKVLFSFLDDEMRVRLIYDYFEDIYLRHKKYGDSPKVLEPNIKFSAGGLRDLQAVEWIYALKNNCLLTDQNEITQTESFINLLKSEKQLNIKELNKLLQSYKILLQSRIYLHLLNNRKNDRLEFESQEKIANMIGTGDQKWLDYMYKYFEASVVINRFTKTMIRKFTEQISIPVSDYLAITIDDDFTIKANVISITGGNNKNLSLSDMLRAFYYRGLYGGIFDENLRTLIIESVYNYDERQQRRTESYVFFREILKLQRNVGQTLSAMNEVGVLGLVLPEFKDLNGFFQPGVYHCFAADEHTLVALNNLEKLEGELTIIGKLYSNLAEKDLLFLAVLFHDIAKPISVSGHEIIGGESAISNMEVLGYDQEEINLVNFLVRHHLTMEQVAFRRNLNDPQALNNFASNFPSLQYLDFLFLLTYADLSAVSPVVWTQWKSDLLFELYRKTSIMIEEQRTGEELLYERTIKLLEDSLYLTNESVKDHIQSINDISYLQQYSEEEINQHVEEIEKGESLSVFFKEIDEFTNITIITKDFDGILSKLCGTLSINDLNIHDAKIFTRKDGIIIDSFNLTDFRTNKLIPHERYEKIKSDLYLTISNALHIGKEFHKAKSKWWRIENRFFKRRGKIKIGFEEHDRFLIIDVFSPDRLGLLYQITKTINELGLNVAFAKISTKGDDVVDSFYTYKNNYKKISINEYELIRVSLTQTIEEML